ncbi:hypothetical protein ASPZODRAFT_18241 [Penicilliopsis zonata CBS 506.65]|uniref:ZW10 C-terminal helical domain-containing protein n=1 Tax=Penicilliopsis zonata CBS 506.65 TaxID=1073090 RepID=A0A1L9SBZ9_9EURO|nr:hypothetical protein ASPZODRAFT_18241 [Penicilliopsis zonata CBS 506.65]OJJ44669.1 hypothetical protein ASPZODRAFT_18241 [Penicilliopsis zonata CBS 506.65]
MGSKVLDDEACQAVLNFVTEGKYPESEDVVASEIPASALAAELQLLSAAREEVEQEISSLSRENIFNAEGWISQARQLHADIERSRVTAREIVAQHEKTKPLESMVEDAAAKVRLIETEISFNQAVTSTLEEVQRLVQQLDAARAVLNEGQIIASIDILEGAEKTVKFDISGLNTNMKAILSENVVGLRQEIVESLRLRWANQLKIDEENGKFAVLQKDTGLEDTILAMSRLDILTPAIDRFQKDLVTAIIDPIIPSNSEGYSRVIHVSGDGIYLDSEPSRMTVSDLLGGVSNLLGCLRQSLPEIVANPLSDYFVPNLLSKIISWLSSTIPTDLDGLDEFEKTLEHAQKFTNLVESLGWRGQDEIGAWINQAPRLWLTRRRVDSLDRVRKVLAASKGTTKHVERVEKEKVAQAEEVLLEAPSTDDWDASWDDVNDGANAQEKTSIPGVEEEEDVSAWGLDDEETVEEKEGVKEDVLEPAEEDDDDGADAWGWGDEDEEKQDDKVQSSTTPVKVSANGKVSVQQSSPREVILKETYTVTDIPESILQIVQQQIVDSEALTQHTHSNSRVAASGAGLLALPTLILAMFKATASSFYALKLNSGQMYLYNDSLYLADQMKGLAEERQLTRLNADIESLEKYGKLAYSKEMQTQRTVAADLLDGAQGFNHCSEQPFLGECENAIAATVDRIRDVYKEWQPILSHSALLQSIGSLLSTVINKIIIDIEDIGDISEPQSQRLVQFCNQVSKLEDLFAPDKASGVEAVPMTAVYVRNWLKFQYLINILESSLADIKFLWLEGELSLEFSPDEVVDLIKALFAESDHRRRAIAEIRRNSRV